MKSSPTISLPQGVRDILPEEARVIGRVESGILSVFEKFGFERVITPLLEYVEVLSLGMGENLKDRVLKFIDPSTGKIVAIRPDITAQIARVASTRMRQSPLPIKLCYNENVLRYQEDGKSREVLQVGAELISKDGLPDYDAEMIIMAIEALNELGLKDFKIDIGDVGFLRTVLERLDIKDSEKKLIKEAIAIKDSSGVEALLNGLDRKVSSEDKNLLVNLTTLYGEEEVIERASSFTKDASTLKALEKLQKVLELVTKKGFKGSVTIDLGEVRGFDYYTGIIFEGFASGVGKPILGGGRYDTLLEKYGYPCAATGFAFDVENLVCALGQRR